MNRRRVLIALIVASLLMLAACGGGGSGSSTQTTTQTLSISTGSLSDGTAGQAYNATVQVTGGSGQFSFSVSGGALPPGLALDAGRGTISGTPTAGGNFAFTVRVVDMQNGSVVTHDYTLHVVGLHFTTTTLPAGTVGSSYSTSVHVAEANGSVTWQVQGVLPLGLQMQAVTGDTTQVLITGTPTVLGTYAITLKATDSVASVTQSWTLGIGLNFSVGPSSLPDAVLGQLYSQQIQVTGGTPPYTYRVNNIVDGLTVTSTGLITGIPYGTTGGVDVTVSYNSGTGAGSARAIWPLNVKQPPFAITTGTLPNARVGANYQAVLTTTAHDTLTVTWSSANLPPGMSLNASTGQVTWAPTATGTFNFNVHAVESDGQTSDHAYSVTVVGSTAAARNDTIANATPLTNGRFRASISPFADANGIANPDQDYYKLTAAAGQTVYLETFAARLTDVQSELDTVIEVVDANGQRYNTCRDPGDDTALGLPIAVDTTPAAYDDGCINDDYLPGSVDSQLWFRVPGTLGQDVTFYVHVIDWRGDARPDFIYDLSISGVK